MRLPALAALALLLVLPAHAAELGRLESGALVRLVLAHRIAHIPDHGGFSIDADIEVPDKRFQGFQGLGNLPGSESAALGSFTVNRLTGEVWNDDDCTRVNFPALRRMQARDRARFHLAPPHAMLPPLC